MPSKTREVGLYRFIARLGSNDFDETFLVQHKEYDTLSVIKKPNPRLETDQEWCDRFRQRAHLWLRLEHPNLINIQSVFEEKGVPYLVMEYLPGESLRVLSQILLQYRYQLRPAATAEIFYALANGLDCFHQVKNDDGNLINPVHGGVKLRNTFICYDGRVKLLDFTTIKEGGFASETADIKTDVFDLGLCIWQLVTGIRPDHNLSDLSVRATTDHENFTTILNTKHANYPIKLRSILTTCLEINSERRFQSAGALRHALLSYTKETKEQRNHPALDYILKHLIHKRKRIRNAMVQSAIQDPHWNDYLLKNPGDQDALPEKKAPPRPISKPKSPEKEKIEKETPFFMQRMPLTILLAGILILFAVLATLLWPSKSKNGPLFPKQIGTIETGPKIEQLEEPTPSTTDSDQLKPVDDKDDNTDAPKSDDQIMSEGAEPDQTIQPEDITKNNTMGYLRLKTQPQTSVYLKKEFMGNTPIEDMELTPGWHDFELINKKANISRVFRVRIHKGQVSSHTIIY